METLRLAQLWVQFGTILCCNEAHFQECNTHCDRFDHVAGVANVLNVTVLVLDLYKRRRNSVTHSCHIAVRHDGDIASHQAHVFIKWCGVPCVSVCAIHSNTVAQLMVLSQRTINTQRLLSFALFQPRVNVDGLGTIIFTLLA